ncbi:response regulator [Shewanella cyperi]|uniref:histidine kinase n=1 Tax=Shewanella cyperi TaxID=2814292 RepID=A0A975ALQ1_9GAMM|nr:ATP-binding protein [Shewanella cyperi]QSX30468.1 response regulator [Shewanella cyperi]
MAGAPGAAVKAFRRFGILPMGALMLVAVCIAGASYQERRLESQVELELQQSMSRSAAFLATKLSTLYDQQQKNLRFLHATPPIAGLARAELHGGVDPLDGTHFSQWQRRLETIFSAMLLNNPEIDQLRVIRGDTGGKEIVRVDRLSGNIRVIEAQRLQSKAQAYYFAATMALAPGQMYISSLDLNREYGQVEFPYRPTTRFALPIFTAEGQKYGFIILNLNTGSLLTQMRQAAGPGEELILVDSQGNFIVHPKPEFQFSRDLDSGHSWQADYRVKQVNGYFGLVQEQSDGAEAFFLRRTVRYGGQPDEQFQLLLTRSRSQLDSMLLDKRIDSYGFVLTILLVASLLLVLLNRNYRSSHKLAETRAEQEAIISGSADAIIGLDLFNRVTSWNRAAEQLFGYSAQTAMGSDIDSLGLFRDFGFSELMARAHAGGSLTATISSNEGDRELQLELTLSPIQLLGQKVCGTALIARDVTAQYEAQSKIRMINQDLESQVASRTEELADAHKKALQASEIKSAFVSNVSHEMRTPLNGIMGTLNLIKREPLSPTQMKYVDMAESSAAALSSLINDILDLSKIEAGKLEFDSQPFNPVRVMETLVCSAAIRAMEKDLEIILDISELDYVCLMGDASRLKQVLNNLLSNAIKFTHKGEILIRARTQVSADNQIRLDVDVFDTGIGIAEENQQKLFQAFSQEHGSISSEYGGTGLGLSISRQLCQLMKGNIGFESEKDRGSHFYFHVYFGQEGAKKEQHQQPLAGVNAAVLSPNPRSKEVLERMLARYGATVMQLNEQRTLPAGELVLLVDNLYPVGSGTALWLSREAELKILRFGSAIKEWPCKVDHELGKPVNRAELLAAITGQVQEVNVGQSQLGNHFPVAALEGAGILVVDDNHINQEVVKGFLAPQQAELWFASTGKQALDIMVRLSQQGTRLNCVLMDCQMPEMDGYVCTKLIRLGEGGEAFRQVPIIAMTANAMSGEREKCLAAGMSDYITKPISYDQLLSHVLQWVTSGAGTPAIAEPKLPSNNLPVWDRKAALARMLDNHTLVDKITRMYVDTVPEKIDHLRSVVETMELNAIRELAHNLKGLSGDIGASQLHRLLAELEQASKQGCSEDINGLFSRICQGFDELFPMLEQHLAGEKSQSQTTGRSIKSLQ